MRHSTPLGRPRTGDAGARNAGGNADGSPAAGAERGGTDAGANRGREPGAPARAGARPRETAFSVPAPQSAAAFVVSRARWTRGMTSSAMSRIERFIRAFRSSQSWAA